MSTTPHHDVDRETLSGLFDGELDGDAARFAVKRLDHDVQWREACGRWQLVGDVLRGQTTGVAPAGFADRLASALQDEGALAPATAGAFVAPAPRRRNWIGGAALAASVAVAALFVVRPFSQVDVTPLPVAPMAGDTRPMPAPAGGADAVIAQAAPSGSSMAEPLPARPVRERPVAMPEPVTTLAAADVRRAAPAARASQAPVEAPAALRDSESAMTAAPVAFASLDDDAMPAVGAETSHPFLPPGEITSRPWPRAALPGNPSGDAFNVGFDSRSSPSSFYPFDPRTLDAPPSSRLPPDAPAAEARD